jgi:hypothetical protein
MGLRLLKTSLSSFCLILYLRRTLSVVHTRYTGKRVMFSLGNLVQPKLLLRDGDFVMNEVTQPPSVLVPTVHCMKLLSQLHDALHAVKKFHRDV